MVFPLWFISISRQLLGPGGVVFGSIEQCGRRWQAVVRYRRIGWLPRCGR
jgi:hypothetical protein